MNQKQSEQQRDEAEALFARLNRQAEQAPDVPPHKRNIKPFDGFLSSGARPREGSSEPTDDTQNADRWDCRRGEVE